MLDHEPSNAALANRIGDDTDDAHAAVFAKQLSDDAMGGDVGVALSPTDSQRDLAASHGANGGEW